MTLHVHLTETPAGAFEYIARQLQAEHLTVLAK
jgi:hypothetical protein